MSFRVVRSLAGWCGVVLCLAASSLVAASPAGAVAGFGDVAEGRYYTEPVQWSVDNDVTGIDGNCFSPDAPVSRGDAAVYIWNMQGQPSGAPAHSFVDVTDESQDAAVSWMSHNEITTGTSLTTFDPDTALNRAHLVTFLWRLADEPSAPVHPFVDVHADWQQGSVSWAADRGITTGTSPTTFDPDDTLTRAHLVTFLYRYRGEPDVILDASTPHCDPASDTPENPTDPSTLATGSEALALPLGDYDRERLLTAAETLDVDAECPAVVVPASLEDVVEVLRIDGGCVIVEYHALNGRSVKQARSEILRSDPTAHAVGVAPTNLEISLQTPSGNALPSDPFDQDQYGAGEWWHLDRLDAAELWSEDGWEYTDSSGNQRQIPGWPDDAEVLVAVIDTGVANHPDLNGQLVRGDPNKKFEWFDDECHIDQHGRGHGTHVAGLIAAIQGNGMDVAGLAPKAKIVPINLLGPSGSWPGDCSEPAPDGIDMGALSATNAVNRARLRGADVINMSFGNTNPDEFENPGQFPDTFDAFEAALDVARLWGVVAVAAAGNCSGRCMGTSEPLKYPAAFPNVIGVAATQQGPNGQDHRRAVFSYRNSSVDIAAPGDGNPSGSGILSTVRNGTDRLSGTSMAAPLVSAVVAHMKARYSLATVQQIIDALQDTATHPIPYRTLGTKTPEYGHGRIEPKKAIEALDEMLRPVEKPNAYQTVSAGGYHSCGVRTDNTITCWGRNEYGQADAPAGAFQTMAAGGEHSCGVRTDNTITCWGWNNRYGQTDAPAGAFQTVSASWEHSCGVRTDNTITCWGNNSSGQADAPAGAFQTVSAGRSHSCGLHADNTITCWGNNSSGQADAPAGAFQTVSAGGSNSCGVRTDNTITCWGNNSSGQADAPAGAFQTVSAGGSHSCGVRTDNTITCWGWNGLGQADAPAGAFQTVSAGGDHSCGVRTDNTITCWGYNPWGQADAPARAFQTVSAGGNYSCGVRTDNTITCWGWNTWYGQTDAPAGAFQTVSAGPVHSCGLRADNTITCWGNNDEGRADAPAGAFQTVSAGSSHSCGLRADNTITCWGNNRDGQADAPAGAFQTVSAGRSHSCGLHADNTITCWGNNWSGKADAPAGAFQTVSTGDIHSCGVRADNTITCWGHNGSGQADAPAGAFQTVSAGFGHSCGLRADDTITCWGWNDYGQADAPAGAFQTVSAGGWSHSCGLRADNTIICWGRLSIWLK